ncbi:MAG: TetR family transcriptional regulator [Paracoccaceae bacterium]
MAKKSTATPKSERTRQAILAAARKSFSEQGYDGATVRRIAERVPIDPAMIMRYFGSKEGLFSASVAVDLQLPDPAKIPGDSVGRALVEHFLVLWEGGEENRGLPILLRSAVSNQDAAEKIREVFAGQIVPLAARVSPHGDPARRAGLAVSQLFGLALCRYILKLPPVVALSRQDIITELGPVIQRHLSED